MPNKIIMPNQILKGLNNPMNEIRTVKGDKEIANELRKKFFDALDPVAELISEANASGFEVGFQFGPNAFGKVSVQQINLMKKY